LLRFANIEIADQKGKNAFPVRVIVTEELGLRIGKADAARLQLQTPGSLHLRYGHQEATVDASPCESGIFLGRDVAGRLQIEVQTFQEKQGEAAHVLMQENAISPDIIRQFCNHARETELKPIGENYRTTMMAPLKGNIEKLTHQVIHDVASQYIEPFYNLEIESWEIPQLLVYHQGGIYNPHADGSHWVKDANGENGRWERFLDRDISFLLYFNDEFTGGKLDFPDLNFKITPGPGLLVAFPSSHSYRHGAERTESGERILLVTWMRAVGTPRTWPKPMTRFMKKDYAR